MEILKEIFQPIIAVASVYVAYLLYNLNSNLRRDNWAKTLREFHQFFWTNSDFEEVRLWIACDEAYEKVQPTLEKRNNNEPLTIDEYNKYIEKIDKFAALITAYIELEPDFHKHKKVREQMFDEYWLNKISNREELQVYVSMFYKNLRNRVQLEST